MNWGNLILSGDCSDKGLNWPDFENLVHVRKAFHFQKHRRFCYLLSWSQPPRAPKRIYFWCFCLTWILESCESGKSYIIISGDCSHKALNWPDFENLVHVGKAFHFRKHRRFCYLLSWSQPPREFILDVSRGVNSWSWKELLWELLILFIAFLMPFSLRLELASM